MSEFYDEYTDDEDNITEWPTFKNCENKYVELNKNNMVSQWGYKDTKEFMTLLENKLFGTCKCLTEEIDYECMCGIINITEHKLVYLSCFKDIIKKRALNGCDKSKHALESGNEINYKI